MWSYKQKRHIYALAAILVVMPFILWLLDPFAQVLARRAVSLNGLNSAQKTNIIQAARAIDGRVLRPGDDFSFNRQVGPRTGDNGYRYAKSFLGSETPYTAGGGICLLSSMLYQCALISQLKVLERSPHLRAINSVPPGFDATVSYGSTDLRLHNNTNYPVMIRCHTNPNKLEVQLLTDRFFKAQPAGILSRRVIQCHSHDQSHAGSQLQVEVYRTTKDQTALISRDLYRLSP